MPHSSHTKTNVPLATLLRPGSLSEFKGQSTLIQPDSPLRNALESGTLHSMIFWGPPGCGKTTLARLFATHAEAHFIMLSAVMVGVKEIRAVVEEARQLAPKQTILFLDEVHRFNKSQQDALLPHIEDGTFVFIGATTENPSFSLNNALLSRTRVYVFERLKEEDIHAILLHAIQSEAFQLKAIIFPDLLLRQLATYADGDARKALNVLEQIRELLLKHRTNEVTPSLLVQACSVQLRYFDRQGEFFYDEISALHKSVRGSDPDAALYWFLRMIDGGCDPLYLARRLIRMASEDIGNADPRALTLAIAARQAFEQLGQPEGELALAQVVLFLASAPKSNAAYVAYNRAKEDIKRYGTAPVPLHLRNAPTQLMKDLGYGKTYRYAHDEPNAFCAGETYFPDTMKEVVYYEPVPRGLEIQIGEKLAKLRALNQETRTKQKKKESI